MRLGGRRGQGQLALISIPFLFVFHACFPAEAMENENIQVVGKGSVCLPAPPLTLPGFAFEAHGGEAGRGEWLSQLSSSMSLDLGKCYRERVDICSRIGPMALVSRSLFQLEKAEQTGDNVQEPFLR